jgi:parvulin-like peptidyl-prolyl isomerase
VLIPYQGATGAAEDVTRTKEQAKTEAGEVRTMALQGSDWFDLARRYSSCPSSEKGGDLGRFGRGVMTRPFEEAAFALKVDEIGPVVETEFGFHVIQRTE